MQFILNFDLFIIAKARQATLREQKKREKQKKQRQFEQLIVQKQLVQQSAFFFLHIDDDDIDVSFIYCHSFQVNEQSIVVFRKSQYIVNDHNEMKWIYDEFYDSTSRICCQDFVTFCRSLFDVVFDVSAMNKNTIFQIKIAQQQLQKKQIEWKFEFFCYWWRIEQQIVTRIKEKLSKTLKDRLNYSSQKYKVTYFKEIFALSELYNAYENIWISRDKWKNDYVIDRIVIKRFYFSLCTIIRNNDIERMRIHIRKKIIYFCAKKKLLKQFLEHYLYDEIQRRFFFIIEIRTIDLLMLTWWKCNQMIDFHLIRSQSIQIIEFDITCFIVLFDITCLIVLSFFRTRLDQKSWYVSKIWLNDCNFCNSDFMLDMRFFKLFQICDILFRFD